MPLPIMASPEELTKLVGYLKNKPTGTSVTEAKAVFGSRLLDLRKLAAYHTWNVIIREGEKIRLSTRGWEYGLFALLCG